MLLLPLVVLCLVVLLIRVWWYWPKRVRCSVKLLTLQLAVSIGIMGCLMLPFSGVLPPGYKMYALGFTKYAQTNLDIPAIRSWLSTLDPNDYAGRMARSVTSVRVNKKDWPEVIARHDPLCVDLLLRRDRWADPAARERLRAAVRAVLSISPPTVSSDDITPSERENL